MVVNSVLYGEPYYEKNETDNAQKNCKYDEFGAISSLLVLHS